MPKNQIIQQVKDWKQKFPTQWFDKACEVFGFEKIIILLGEINA